MIQTTAFFNDLNTITNNRGIMKKQVCLIIAVFCCLNMQAQYEQQWGMEYPWNESLKIVSAVLYGDGYALTGTFSDTLVLGTDTLCSNGMEDVFLLLLSSEGKVANAFSYGDSGVDVPTGICNDNGRHVCSVPGC